MLPTTGYFRGVACPAHEKGQCNRPYCHFRHNPKKETSSAVPIQSTSATNEDKDSISNQIKNKPSAPSVKSVSVEDSPSCSSTEASSILNSSIGGTAQSELLQQLVSEAVKKVLIENPHLASVGVDPSTLIAQTTAEVSPANSKLKKKYYCRPPDTPSYNPTPIKELNKRKRSGEFNEDSPSNTKAAKYVPASLKNMISDASENKESGDSELTDFSSAEDEDIDKQNCDFDILEEVLAEHSQNNKIKVKKKKVKALGKLQYNLSNRDKKVDEASMISDARTLSDQDSNTCDAPKDNLKDYQEPVAGSYFLPPSPIFTSSSDGFGAYNSIVFAQSDTNEVEDSSKLESVEDSVVVKELEENSKISNTDKHLETSKISDQKKGENCNSKKVAKGHALLPKVVHALGAPKMSRPNIRSWNPQSRNANAVDSTCKEGSDPLEAMLQQMDGVQVAQKEGGESSNTSSDTTRPATSSPKNSKKYKVDLDKEIKSLTSTSSVNNKEKDKIVDEEVDNPESNNVQKEKECEMGKKLVSTDIKLKMKEGGNDASAGIKESSKVVSPKIKQKQAIASSDSKSEKKSSDAKETIDKEKKSHDESSDADEKLSCDERSNAEESIDREKKSHDESSDAEETVDKQKKSHDESETEPELKRKKRKRDHSSGSESHESYHRKKRKKSHKRRKKYKKRRRRRDSRSDSDDSDGESGKEDKDDEKEEKDKSDVSEGDDKEESGKPKKHKKRKKKSRHRKKSKYKRSKSKLKKKDRSRSQSASLSSSQDRSRSTSQHRSRSSSRYRSRSSSRHRSRSSNRHRSRSLSRHRSRSLSRHRSRSLSRHRSRSLSRHRSRSLSRHRSRSLSKERSKSPKKNRPSSRSCSTSQESVNQAARHGKDSKSKSQTTNDTVTNSKKDKEKNYQISMPMPIDPSKIKVEKEDIPKNTNVIVPDLSIVKTEKEDRLPLPSTSIKIEKSDNQSETMKSLNSTNKSKNSSNEKTKLSNITSTFEKPSSHHEERKELSNAGMKKDSSSHQKLSKETNLQAKEKEHKKASILGKERRKSNCDRRNSTESISNRKFTRRDSTDVKKSDKEQNSQKASVNERRGSTEKNKGVTVSEKSSSTEKIKGGNVSERRGSTEKNKDNTNMSRGSNQDSQAKGLSMFDMVMASIDPPKPRALKEISLFDSVSAVGYESSSDTTSPTSDLDEEYLSQGNKDQDKSSNQPSTNHPSNNQKKSSSHSTSRDKHSSGSKTDKVKSPIKSEKDKHSHKSSTNPSKSKAHRESESDSKHAHSSSSKQKTSSHHSSSSSQKISSSSQKISSSSHKTSSNTSKELNNCNDNSSSVSNKTSHSSSSKNKEAKSSSHAGKQDNKNHSSRSNHDRKHSVGNHEKEKEYSSTTHKSREHGKKSSDKEKEHASGNHGKGKESSSKDGLDSEKDTSKSGSHEKLKESSKNRHDKEKERSNKKESIMKDKLKMEENEVSSSSERELFAANDEEDDSSSPFPDLSVLDEIPQDDWEQMINTEGREDLKHLENLRTEEDFDLDDLDKDDPDVMEECLQMYNDYKPDPVDVEQQSSKKKMRVEPKQESELLPSKQRIARATSGGNMLSTKPSSESRRRKKTPAQVMMDRYQKLKEQQAELLKQLERQKQQLEEQGRGVSAAASSSTVSSSTSSRSKHAVVSSSNVSSTTSSRSKIAPASSSSTSLKSSPHSTSGAAPKRRMSHVPNVSSLLQERERIKNLPPTNSRSLLSPNVASASGSALQTIAHTVAKGGRRCAHVPQIETLQRPTIAAEFGSKVPPNIRQRYLNSLIDECLKFQGEREAFNLGMAEERVCYQRASSRMVYLNLAVNAVKRLRTQQEAGEAAQELMESDPMFKGNASIEEPSTSEKPSTSGISSSPAKEVKPHPINPNHSRFSHFSVLAVGGQRGTWSIEKPKKSTVNVQNILKGSLFYKYLKKYLLDEKQLGDNGYPSPDPEEKGKAILKAIDTRKKLSPSAVERYCDRCSVLYTVDKWGFPLCIGPCVHHWGRPYKRRGYSGMETRYSCCGGDLTSDGCSQATTHVSQNYNPNELRGYVRTLPKDVKNNDYGVYALDCEMCYTTAGNELTRITIVDTEGKTVYEQLVKPENPIIDYNTRFSGITESDMEDVKTTIRDVQASMLTRFCDKTILIGHSLESDFHALKLIHDTVVDTSVVFPHKMGPPFKRALKNLASEYLKKIIQNDVSGHDSAEDALTCMHLMKWRIKEDLKGFKK